MWDWCGEMLIWRELAHQNWWNYSSPNTTASWCYLKQMLDFWLVCFDSYYIRCCCYYCYGCWCCWCYCYCCCCCHCHCWRSVDSFRYASEFRHNHSRTRFYYYTNKTGLQHRICIFFTMKNQNLWSDTLLPFHCDAIDHQFQMNNKISNEETHCDSHTCDYIVDMQNTPSDKRFAWLASPSQMLESTYCTLHNDLCYRTV